MAGGNIGTDSLFLGLTRPPMIFGVTYNFASINGLFSLLVFIITENFFYLLVLMPFIHGIFYLLCLKEPRALELFIMKYSKFNICKNRMYYSGTNSYDAY
jgi:type IV secretion system protein VirB3